MCADDLVVHHAHPHLLRLSTIGREPLLPCRYDHRNIGYCDLDVSTRNRGAVIDAFRSGDAPVFLISLKAGGFSLTLTEANYVLFLDPGWNPAVEAQAVNRAANSGTPRRQDGTTVRLE